jgi:RTX calcium-binding nonapeptide repeat (4 copies)
MRRTVLLMVSIALGVLFVSGIALAVTKKCSSSPCYGSRHNDTLMEWSVREDDKIYGLGGDDTIRASRWGEFPPDTDILHGNGGSDRLKSLDLEGRDVLYGGKGRNGHDVCLIDGGDRTHGCEKVKRISFRAD